MPDVLYLVVELGSAARGTWQGRNWLRARGWGPRVRVPIRAETKIRIYSEEWVGWETSTRQGGEDTSGELQGKGRATKEH